jgi:ADP-ribose pyrophosphatase YjhB (NUDIX family)
MDPNLEFLTSHIRQIIRSPGRLFVGLAIHKIVRGNLALLLMRRQISETDPNLWEIPAGEVELTDENIEQAIRRIVFEQTEMRVVTIEDELGSLKNSRDNEYPLTIQINFRVRVNEEVSTRAITEPSRCNYTDFAWLTQHELVNYDLRVPIAMEELADEAFNACIEAEMDY